MIATVGLPSVAFQLHWDPGVAIFGLSLAYVALFFGGFFFLFAARYYLATITVLLSSIVSGTNGKKRKVGENGATYGRRRTPMVSVHIPLYNEKNVAERILLACSLMKIAYPRFEVVVVDDSTDETVEVLEKWKTEPGFKIVHREDRKGFKGGALNEALKHTNPSAEFVLVLDADFVPPPDLIYRFLDYFRDRNGNANGKNERYSKGELAAVQGYQMHGLNRAENWLTKGVTCEYSGNYMIDREFQEVAGVMKMIAGSVYLVRVDLLRKYGWSESITEDWELTLRLYRDGYKVLYTPIVQAAAECPSSLERLIRQRMRWAEGHTFNMKKLFVSLIRSPKLSWKEKLEFLYFSPYYLQSTLLIVGTFFWLTSDVVLGARLPFWTAELGWTLVFTNLLALPLMSIAGLFLEKRARRDFGGLASMLLLVYALAPYQAYASLKGLIESKEGTWVRTYKTGRVKGFLGKMEPRKIIRKALPPRKAAIAQPGRPMKGVGTRVAVAGLLVIVSILLIQAAAGAQGAPPAYYFSSQQAPSSYMPLGGTPAGVSFLMHVGPPYSNTTATAIGNDPNDGPLFFSDPAQTDMQLPSGSSVSVHVWVNVTSAKGPNNAGTLNFQMEVYDPQANQVRMISGVPSGTVQLKLGVNAYDVSWGNIDQGQVIHGGETLVIIIWSTGTMAPPNLLLGSQGYPSYADFPVEVPENLLPILGAPLLLFAVAGLYVTRGAGAASRGSRQSGYREIQRVVIVAAAVFLLSLPLVATFDQFLTTLANGSGLSGVLSLGAPYEAEGASLLLRSTGLQAGSAGSNVWIAGGFLPVVADVNWNCTGWQAFVLFGLTSAFGLGQVRGTRRQILLVLVGVAGTFAVNVLRIASIVLLGHFVGYPIALIFHDYAGTALALGWLLAFWSLALNPSSGTPERGVSPEAVNAGS